MYKGQVLSAVLNTGTATDPATTSVDADWYRPAVDVNAQIQLQGTPNTSYGVELYVLDLFDTDTAVIDALHADGRKMICYFSAGTFENWRDDANRFTAADKGRRLDHIWATPDTASAAHSSRVLRHVRGWEQPSDHAPVLATFDL